MEIRSETRLHHPVEAVFAAYRDHMPEVAAFVPDVKAIRVVERTERDDEVVLHNEWTSDREIPALVSKFIRPEHLCWDDHATWTTSTRTCTWRIATRAFTDAVHCTGTTTLVDDADETRVILQGDLRIDLKEIPGVPGFLTSRMAPQVERFIVGLITPNLEKTNAAIGRFLDGQA